MNAKTIARKKNAGQTDSFETLRRDGIALVQRLSGAHWTDFNAHDPGVTILEHLCFALTDLIYRTKFPLQDYLTPETGHIDWRALALHSPQDILTCRPTTTADIRKAILDAVESVENVWLETKERGLYTIAVRLAVDIPPERAATAAQEVRNAFHATRNLCEDIDDVVVLEERDYELDAAIDVTGDAEPADVLAQIYYDCSRYMAASVAPLAYREALSGNPRFEEIFEGPLTLHGVIPPDELSASPNDDRTDLYPIIRNVAGVEQIRSINLRPIGGVGKPTGKGQRYPLPRLRIPQRAEDIGIKLLRSNSILAVSFPALLTAYNKLNFRQKSLRHMAHDPGTFIQEPPGQFRDLRQYASIQNDFPLVYGIGAFGLSESALPHDHARALQLKAYLLLFEQVMANFLANLQNVRQLFSVHGVRRSYVSQDLDNAAIPNIETVYAEGGVQAVADRILRNAYDLYRYTDRKSRLLDYQLAMYGDGLPELSMRQFDRYSRQDEIEETVLRNKTALLENIVAVNRDRAAAITITALSRHSGNTSGLAMRVSLLLGLQLPQERPLSEVFAEHGLQLVPDIEFEGTPSEGPANLEYVGVDDTDSRASEELFESSFRLTPEARQKLFGDIVFLRENRVSPSILMHGVREDRYAIASVGDRSPCHLGLNVSDDADSEGRWVYLATYPDKSAAAEAAHGLRRFLIDLNMRSEGLHVVEHILLRPDRFDLTTESPQDDAFFPFRISVVFPEWPARFRNEEYRKHAEQTVLVNCPAHVYAECHWLEYQQMRDFEYLHRDLLTRFRTAEGSHEGLRSAAAAMEEFLRGRSKQ